MGTFWNVSNHPQTKWAEAQIDAALDLMEIRDIQDVQFPNVDPHASAVEVRDMAVAMIDELTARGLSVATDVAMVQGEFSFTHHLTCFLEAMGMRVVVACSERRVSDVRLADGTVKKESIFQFVQFRQVSLVINP